MITTDSVNDKCPWSPTQATRLTVTSGAEFDSASPLSGDPVFDLDSCQTYCDGVTGCLAVVWSGATATCFLYDIIPTTEAGNDDDFYNFRVCS